MCICDEVPACTKKTGALLAGSRRHLTLLTTFEFDETGQLARCTPGNPGRRPRASSWLQVGAGYLNDTARRNLSSHLLTAASQCYLIVFGEQRVWQSGSGCKQRSAGALRADCLALLTCHLSSWHLMSQRTMTHLGVKAAAGRAYQRHSPYRSLDTINATVFGRVDALTACLQVLFCLPCCCVSSWVCVCSNFS